MVKSYPLQTQLQVSVKVAEALRNSNKCKELFYPFTFLSFYFLVTFVLHSIGKENSSGKDFKSKVVQCTKIIKQAFG